MVKSKSRKSAEKWNPEELESLFCDVFRGSCRHSDIITAEGKLKKKKEKI